MDTVELLKALTSPCGVSGCEADAQCVASDLLSEVSDSVRVTSRGTVLGELNGEGPSILLDAHLDQVGFIITNISENGFVRFDKCGGTDVRTLSGLEVMIYGKRAVYGIISAVPPHLADPKDDGRAKPASELAIDTGLSDAELAECVSLGDRSVPIYTFEKLRGKEVVSGALDDRSGVAVLIKALELIGETVKSGAKKPRVTVSLSVQEEVGGYGAGNAAFEIDADMALAVDVSFARTPGCKPEESAEIGKGPMVGIAPVLNNGISEKLSCIAKEKNIPYQLEIMTRRTGTHADEIAVTRSGIKTGLVSIPLKYMHTPVEVMNTDDIDNTAKLIAEFCLRVAEEGEF